MFRNVPQDNNFMYTVLYIPNIVIGFGYHNPEEVMRVLGVFSELFLAERFVQERQRSNRFPGEHRITRVPINPELNL